MTYLQAKRLALDNLVVIPCPECEWPVLVAADHGPCFCSSGCGSYLWGFDHTGQSSGLWRFHSKTYGPVYKDVTAAMVQAVNLDVKARIWQ